MHDCGEAYDDGRLDTGRPQEVSAGEVGDVVSHLRGGKGCIRSTTAMKRTSGFKRPSIAPRRSPWPPSPWHGRRARECALDGTARASRLGGSPRAGRVLGDQLRKTERRAWGASRGDLFIIVMITAPDLPLSTAPSVFDVSYLPGSYLCLSHRVSPYLMPWGACYLSRIGLYVRQMANMATLLLLLLTCQ